MRVLYVNQTSRMSGAERSLLDLLGGLPEEVLPSVACPPGELRSEVEAMGVPGHDFPETAVSFRLHPVHTLAGGAWLGRASLSLRALARREGAKVVHANTARAAIAAGAAARIGGPPVIAHLRDWVPPGRAGRWALRWIELGASAIVANSRYVAQQLPRGRGSPPVEVIHNPVDTQRFDPDRIDRGKARQRLGLEEGHEVLSVVAHFTPWKAQDDAIRMLAGLKATHPDMKLVLAGSAKFVAPSARYDSREFERHLKRIASELGVGRDVLFIGERDDIPEVLRATDILLVPSHREAFGRLAVEAMAMRIPVVATSVGGPAEIVRDRVDGVVLPPRQPEQWAAAIAELWAQPEVRAGMGARGRERALTEFAIGRHVERVLSVYERVLDSAPKSGGS
jgi:glycosyltransferase involved in cell wall biosynthesis